MASSSYFKSKDKLNDKNDHHAWKMSLDLTLEENEVMDYVQGKIVEPPSNTLVATKTKYNKGEVKAFKSIWLLTSLSWAHLRRCMTSWLEFSMLETQIKSFLSRTS